jgi:hypothetical protein
MKHLTLFSLLLALVQAPASEPGFTSLFDGKEFTGWKISNPDSFKIEDGAIVANGTAGHAYYDGPFLNHTFKNFELKVDVMTRQNSNGGIYVHTDFQEKGFPRKGFEIQVNNTYKSGLPETGGRAGRGSGRAHRLRHVSRPHRPIRVLPPHCAEPTAPLLFDFA